MLQTFEQFLNTKATYAEVIQEQRLMYKNIFAQFKQVEPVLNEAYAMVDMGIFDDMLIEHLMVMDETEINENLFKKAKDKFDSAVATAKEKGKSALSDTQKILIKLGGDIGNIIKLVVKELASMINEAYTISEKLAMKAAQKSKDDIVETVKGLKDANLLNTEIKNAKKMLNGLALWVKKDLLKKRLKV